MSYQQFSYRVAVPENPEVVVFVQGMLARNFRGWLWLWREMNAQLQSVKNASGCLQVKGGVVGPSELLLVSYWKDFASLRGYFKSPAHLSYMRHLVKHPEDLSLWSETYQPKTSGAYLHEPHGVGLAYPKIGYQRSSHDAGQVAEVTR